MLQKHFVFCHEEDKVHLRELENIDEVELLQNLADNTFFKNFNLLSDIGDFNPHKFDESFKNKIKEIIRDVHRQDEELDGLIEAKKKEVVKGLSSERIQQFNQFEADESHVGDQCQVCLEEVEVGRLMKQLDCGGRHSFCSVCIDQWFANHKTCPTCRHVFSVISFRLGF